VNNTAAPNLLMKTTARLAFVLAALLAGPAPAFAAMGDLTEPGLALRADFPAAARTNLAAALRRPDCKFLGGTWFNSNTHLKYGGDTLALNLFLEAITKCPGITLSIRFHRYDADEQLDWVVDHYGDLKPDGVCVRVNLNSKRINLDSLIVPDTNGPRLPEKQ
jgi:hypothetical protein